MPVRLVDGDALWRSDKLSQIQPPEYRAEYANMLPLAQADGTFECNPRRVWADVYSYNRPDITVEMVEKILTEFERVGLLKKSVRKGKEWGFWVGIESRLPVAGQSQTVVATRSQSGRNAVAGQSQLVATPATHPLESTTSQSQNSLPQDLRGLDVKNLTKVDADALFGQAKRVFRRFVGKSLGSLGNRGNQWQELVAAHGETVLAAVELWAQEGGKGLRNINWPLAMFLKNAEEFIEAAKQTESQKAEVDDRDSSVEASIAAGHAEGNRQLEEFQKTQAEQDEIARRITENPSELFGG